MGTALKLDKLFDILLDSISLQMPAPITYFIRFKKIKRFFYLLFLVLLTGLISLIISRKSILTMAVGQTTTFIPIVDAYVNESYPDSNFGSRISIRVDGSPVLHSYIRFNIQNLAGTLLRASLRVYANSDGHSGYKVWGVADNSWKESTITYSNAPKMSGAMTGASGTFTKNSWISVDITPLVTGNGLLTLGLTTDGPTQINLASRESGVNAPQLVIETSADSVVPVPAGELTFPIRAAFYYPWFPQAWTQQGIFPYTNFNPSLGFYDLTDQAILKQQIAAMKYGKIQAGIASWWGQRTNTDNKMSAILQASVGTGFFWSIYYEPEGQSNPTVDQIQNDLIYIRDHYSNDPSYLKIGGRFVVFAYADPADNCAMADRWAQANTVNAHIVLKVFSSYKTCASQPDGWHQYGPAVAEDSQAGYSFSISPGFWKVGEVARLTRDLTRWIQNIHDMIASNAPWQLITTFNEWGEGSTVESAQEWSTASYGSFLDALHNDGAALAAPTSTPIPLGGVDPILVGAGDIASCSSFGDEATAKLLDSIFAGGATGSVFTAGDDVYDSGTALEFANCYNPSWGQLKDKTKPAVGNHEYLTTGASGYFNYFGAAAGDSAKGYYSYDLGSWHILVINSNCSKVGGCGVGSQQEKWVRADLTAHPGLCQAAYWHHPRFSSGQHGSYTSMQPIWQALYDNGVDVVLNGHDHDYERFAPQDPSGGYDPINGIREFVVGTGGKNHYSFPGAFIQNSEVGNEDTFGVLKFTLHPGSYDWQFLPEAGKTFTDSGTQLCH